MRPLRMLVMGALLALSTIAAAGTMPEAAVDIQPMTVDTRDATCFVAAPSAVDVAVQAQATFVAGSGLSPRMHRADVTTMIDSDYSASAGTADRASYAEPREVAARGTSTSG